MRILYVDCDSLRPDHLGCYGYERDTSPTIDRLADEGRRFTNCYVSDAPCLPSRTALFTGRFGIHTGVVNHGGLNAEPSPRGRDRGFNTGRDGFRTFPAALREAGLRTALISPFPTRHGAWHVLDGFDEWRDTGGNGRERADVVEAAAGKWLDDHAAEDDWYLHVNFWDPHTPYDTPMDYGEPFADAPAPEWPGEERIADHYESYGPHSAHEPHGWGEGADLERAPEEIASREDFGRWIDGYDTGIRYMDDHLGDLLDRLDAADVLEDTLIVVSADHGENQGELNVYGDHQTADEATCRVPLIVRGPDVEPGLDHGLHYGLDLAPTLTELAGGDPAPRWDGESFADAVTEGAYAGREFLVLSQGAWACQRAVRWDDWLMIRTYHDGYKDVDPVELYLLDGDPHEGTNQARIVPDVVRDGLAALAEWKDRRLLEAATGRAGGNPDAPRGVTDPLFEVIREGGPFHVRGHLESYAERLRETGREEHAEKLERDEGIVSGEVEAFLEDGSPW